MEKKNVKEGDVVVSSDGTLVKVHSIGYDNEVFYYAYYADASDNRIAKDPYDHYYGYIDDCCPATSVDKEWMERWIQNSNNDTDPAVANKSFVNEEYWRNLRHQAAIAALQGYCSNPHLDDTFENYVKWAVEQSYRLITELKNEKMK